jgi:hypothetical protein
MRQLVYFNDELLDTDDKSSVYATYKPFDFFNITSRFVAFSNSINVPKTERNVSLLGHVSDSRSDSQITNQINLIRVITDDLEWIRNWPCIIKSSVSRFGIHIYQPMDFFDLIKEKKINETFTASLAWNDTNIKALRNTIDEIIRTPAMDQGRNWKHEPVLKDRFFQMQETHWDQEGDNDSQWFFNPIENDGIITSITSVETSSNRLYQEQRFLSDFEYNFIITFDVLVFNSNATFWAYFVNIENDTTSVETIGSLSITSSGLKTANFTKTPTNNKQRIAFLLEYASGANQTTIGMRSVSITTTSPSVMNIKIPYYLPLISYKSVIEHIITNVGFTSGIDWDSINMLCGVDDYDKRLSVTLTSESLNVYKKGDTINFGQYLPDVTHDVFFKDFIVRFGLLVNQTDDNVIQCIPLQKVLTDPFFMKDWTSKRDAGFESEIKFNSTKYAVYNRFENDDFYGQPDSSDFFRMSNNKVLRQEIKHYESFFANCFNKLTTRRIGFVPLFSYDTDEFLEIGENRSTLVTLLDYSSSSDNVEYAGELSTAHKIVRQSQFPGQIEAFNQTHWGHNLIYFYSSLFGLINTGQDLVATNSFRLIKRRYFITAEDMEDFRFPVIFDDGDIMLVLNAPNVRPNSFVNCDLVKIG